MVKRNYWLNLIEKLWKKKNIIWLYGVRRVGKTFLCKSLKDIEYFDCELPSVRNAIEEDVESFLESFKSKRLVIDEIHRVKNPSELLKIASDYYPQTQIIATGSSTLAVNKKFKDTLTGRKLDLWLTPINYSDLIDFDIADIENRFSNGGLPPYLISQEVSEKDYFDWIENY